MRAMEYTSVDQREIVITNLIDEIGQWPFESPTVFNFYEPEYQPARFVDDLVAPEFQIFTPPFLVGFLNGMMSLIEHGLSECDAGFGKKLRTCNGAGTLLFGEGLATAI